MIELLMAAALLQASTPNPHWEFLQEIPDAQIYVDPDSVTRDGDTFQINTRIVYRQVQSTGMKIGTFRSRYDCVRATVAYVHITVYAEDGEVLVDNPATSQFAEPRPVPEGTPYAAVMGRFCPPAPAKGA